MLNKWDVHAMGCDSCKGVCLCALNSNHKNYKGSLN